MFRHIRNVECFHFREHLPEDLHRIAAVRVDISCVEIDADGCVPNAVEYLKKDPTLDPELLKNLNIESLISFISGLNYTEVTSGKYKCLATASKVVLMLK